MGSYVEAYLDLQRLRSAAPSWPGLLQLMEEAATLSLAHQSDLRASAVRSPQDGDTATAEAPGCQT